MKRTARIKSIKSIMNAKTSLKAKNPGDSNSLTDTALSLELTGLHKA